MSLERRIRELEEKLRVDKVALHFADGSIRSIRGDKLLEIFIAAMDRKYAAVQGQPQPVSEFDVELDLLAKAVPTSGCDPFVHTIISVLQS